jgi:hypothetical protein
MSKQSSHDLLIRIIDVGKLVDERDDAGVELPEGAWRRNFRCSHPLKHSSTPIVVTVIRARKLYTLSSKREAFLGGVSAAARTDIRNVSFVSCSAIRAAELREVSEIEGPSQWRRSIGATFPRAQADHRRAEFAAAPCVSSHLDS